MDNDEMIDFRDRIVTMADSIKIVMINCRQSLDTQGMAAHKMFCIMHDIASLLHTIIMNEFKREGYY